MGDVLLLRGLVAAAQKQDQFIALLDEIDAISRPMVDPQFEDALADTLEVAGISHLETGDAPGDPQHGRPVPKPFQPSVELGQPPDLH